LVQSTETLITNEESAQQRGTFTSSIKFWSRLSTLTVQQSIVSILVTPDLYMENIYSIFIYPAYKYNIILASGKIVSQTNFSLSQIIRTGLKASSAKAWDPIHRYEDNTLRNLRLMSIWPTNDCYAQKVLLGYGTAALLL
jgi:hypothetical protein